MSLFIMRSITLPIPNATPIPNRNPNLTVSLMLSQTNAKPDACAKNYLAIVRNYYSTKTADLQAEHKYTTKANLCTFMYIRQILPCFGIM